MGVAFTELPVRGEALRRLRDQLVAISPMLSGAQANLRDVAGDYADIAL